MTYPTVIPANAGISAAAVASSRGSAQPMLNTAPRRAYSADSASR